MIATTLIPDALSRDRSYSEVHYRPGLKVRHVLEDLGGDPDTGKWLAIRSGRRCSLDDPVDLNDNLVLARFPSGILTFIVFAVISSLISFGVSLLINALMGSPGQPSGPTPEGTTYGFSGIRNTRTQGTSIPVIYGTHRVGGQILTLYRRNVDADSTTEFLYMLIGLGAGQVTQIGHLTDDADALSNEGEAEDDFTIGADQDFAVRIGWKPGELTPDPSGISNFTAGDDIGRDAGIAESGLVQWVDGIGLGLDGWTASWKVKGAATAGHDLEFAFTAKDRDNYHFVRPQRSGDPDRRIEVGHLISGSETILATYDAGVGNVINAVIRVERIGDQVEVLVDEVSVGTFTASATLSSTAIGFAVQFLGGGPAGRLADDFLITTVGRLPDDMHVNGSEANAFKAVTCWTRMGRPKNKALPVGSGFEKVIQGYTLNLPISTSWTRLPTREEVQGFQIVLNFPRGLFNQTSGLAFYTVELEVEYRENDADPWTPLPGSPFSFRHKLTASFSRTVFHEPGTPLEGTKQAVRFRRVTAAQTENPKINDDLQLGSFNEVTKATDQTYDDIALVALKIEANANLSGGTPVVTNLVKGIPIPTWDGGAGGATTPEIVYAFGQNTAWVALNILLDKQFGLGNWVELADVDMVSWVAWADWCDELLEYAEAFDEPIFQTRNTEAISSGATSVVVDDATDAAQYLVGSVVRIELERLNQIVTKTDLGGGRFQLDLVYPAQSYYAARFTLYKFDITDTIEDARNTYEGVFDGEISAWEALLQVCRAGRAVPVKEGRKWRIRFEDEDPVSQVISDANIVKDSLELSYAGTGDAPDIMEAQYLDVGRDYDQNVVIAKGFSLDPKRLPRRETIQLYGVTRERQARREANFRLRATKLLRRQIKFAVLLDGLATESGDVISVGLTMPGWTVWAGRCRGSTASFIIDQGLSLPPDADAIIRNGSDRPGTQVNILSPAGDYPAGSTILTDASPDDELLGDATIIVTTTTTAPTPWRVTRVSINDDLTAAIEAIQYDPDVYLLPGIIPNITPVNGCLSGGTYVADIDTDWGALCTSPTPPVGGVCCFEGVCEVTVSGSSASCVTIIEIVGTKIIFTIAGGCACGVGVICFDVVCTGSWVCCEAACAGGGCGTPLFNWCPCLTEFCNKTTQICYDVCCEAFGPPGGSGFSSGFESNV